MAPLFVHDVEGVMVDERVFLPDIDAAVPETVRLENRSVCPVDEDAEKSGVVGGPGKMFLDEFVFAVITVTKDEGNVVLCGERLNPAAEMSGKPHQMCIVKMVVIAVKHAPPGAESAAAVQQGVICIDDDAINAIVGSVEQVGIIFGELVSHGVHCPVKAIGCSSFFVGATNPSLNPHNCCIRDCGGVVKRKIASVVSYRLSRQLQKPPIIVVKIFFSLQLRSNHVPSSLRVKGRRITTEVTV